MNREKRSRAIISQASEVKGGEGKWCLPLPESEQAPLGAVIYSHKLENVKHCSHRIERGIEKERAQTIIIYFNINPPRGFSEHRSWVTAESRGGGGALQEVAETIRVPARITWAEPCQGRRQNVSNTNLTGPWGRMSMIKNQVDSGGK